MSKVGRSERKPDREPLPWEPEVLELPLDRPGRHRESGNDDRSKSDLPGSHVIVIDLA